MGSLKLPSAGSASQRHRVPRAPPPFSSSTSRPSTRPAVDGGRSRAVVVGRAKLGETALFGDSTSSLLGGLPTTPSDAASAKPKAQVEDVPLLSEAGMDYSGLRNHLKAGDFKGADDETRALLIKLAGPDAVKRGWVYFSEVKSIPSKDLQTIDALWKTASGGKFGYSVQRDIWNQQQKRWARFIKQLDWVVGENNIYRKWPAEFTYSIDAVRGHLPLTNALRGTQLFEALLEHPAFEKASTGKSIDDTAREQALSASKLSSGGSLF